MIIDGIAGPMITTMALRRWPGLGLFAVGIIVMLAWEFPTLPTIATVAGCKVDVARIGAIFGPLYVTLFPLFGAVGLDIWGPSRDQEG